jgi:hypothetical protein
MTRSQLTLAGTGFEKYTKMTRRAQFLAEMDRVVPWRLRDVQAGTPAQPTLRSARRDRSTVDQAADAISTFSRSATSRKVATGLV